MPDSQASVTEWLQQFQAGDSEALRKIWERYYGQLVALARQRLGGAHLGVADEEDAVTQAFDSFCRGVARGSFPNLHDRNNLLTVLVTLTVRQVVELRQREGRVKRGGRVRTQDGADGALMEIISKEPTPAFVAQTVENYQRLLDRLGNDDLRQIARWKLEGYRNDEIAVRLGRAVATVERRLKLIRTLWQEELNP